MDMTQAVEMREGKKVLMVKEFLFHPILFAIIVSSGIVAGILLWAMFLDWLRNKSDD